MFPLCSVDQPLRLSPCHFGEPSSVSLSKERLWGVLISPQQTAISNLRDCWQGQSVSCFIHLKIICFAQALAISCARVWGERPPFCFSWKALFQGGMGEFKIASVMLRKWPRPVSLTWVTVIVTHAKHWIYRKHTHFYRVAGSFPQHLFLFEGYCVIINFQKRGIDWGRPVKNWKPGCAISCNPILKAKIYGETYVYVWI